MPFRFGGDAVHVYLTINIIPAHAGNTWNAPTCWANKRDHPRTCGEHLIDSARRGLWSGSSPHMRGTQQRALADVNAIGIIPAHAGNTHPPTPYNTSGRDHPRTCGEHILLTNVLTGAWGSSPRMRGTRELGGPAAPGLGIIPAHAGNTSRFSKSSAAAWDHPRACGEHAA